MRYYNRSIRANKITKKDEFNQERHLSRETLMNQRLKRLADQIQRTLAVIIRDELNDPRLTGLVTISSVKVSSDLGYADVYVTILEPDGQRITAEQAMIKDNHLDSLKVLNNAAGFLRTELSHDLKTRTTPRLRFHYDEVVAQANRMMNLVNEAMQKTTKNDNGADSDDSDIDNQD